MIREEIRKRVLSNVNQLRLNDFTLDKKNFTIGSDVDNLVIDPDDKIHLSTSFDEFLTAYINGFKTMYYQNTRSSELRLYISMI